jgi:hypothetical protein
MIGVAVLDANLLVLWAVGPASRRFIGQHKRLGDYSEDDFELLSLLIAQFSDVVLLPHILTEASNLMRQIANPARARIQNVLRILISTIPEIPIPSIAGVQRAEFEELGLADAVLLHFCSMTIEGLSPTLITVDTNLANAAFSQGYGVIDYKADFQER